MSDNNFIPQVDYTSRDFTSIKEDLQALIPLYAPQWTNRDPSDFGIVLTELFAYMGDLINYYIDRSANEAYITTASQRENVLKIAALLGYTPTDAVPSKTTLTFSYTAPTGGASTYTVPALTQVSTNTVVNGQTTPVVFETDSALTLTSGSPQTVTATQGTTVTSEVVGVSDGTAGQAFILSQTPVINSSIAVTVNDTVYTAVTYLIESSGDAAVFTTYTDAYSNTYVLFGDNVGGRIPPTNAQVYVTYRVGGGSLGNVAASSKLNIISNFTPGLTCSSVAATGGADPESTDSIRVNAPKSIRSTQRAVALRDYGDLAVAVSGVAKAVATASVYTNVNLYIALFGDTGVDSQGNLTAGFTSVANNVLNYLVDKTPPNVTVTILPPTFVKLNVSLSVQALPTYKQSVVNTNVLKAINAILAFDNVNFADRISLHYLTQAVAAAPGVDYSNFTLIARNDAAQTGTNDAIFATNEIPQAGTINITVTGGIAG